MTDYDHIFAGLTELLIQLYSKLKFEIHERANYKYYKITICFK